MDLAGSTSTHPTDRDALARSEARFRTVLNHAMAGVVQTDAAGRIVLVNRHGCEMLGYTEAELLGLSAADITAPDSLPATLAAIDGLVRGGNDFVLEKAFRRKDGSQLWGNTSVSALRDGTGRFDGMVAVIVDVSALRESERRFRDMADSAPVMLWLTRPDGACVYVSRSWVEFTGESAEAGLGHRWLRNLHADDRAEADAAARAAHAERAPFRLEYRLRRHDGSYRWVLDAAVPRFGEGEAFLGYIGSVMDISDRKQAEQALKDADRRKDEFLATLAHELRNPLAPIRNSLAVLQLGDGDPSHARLYDMMERQVGHMVRLVDDLLELSRITRGSIELRRERVDLAAVLHSAIETSRPLIERSGHHLSIALPETPVLLDADPVRLAQVFANLLNNAAKYTPDRGHIALEVERHGDAVEVTVGDDGLGIAAEMLPRVFEMFTQVTRGRGGLGIGLALARSLLQLHGGRVEAHSDGLGRGSRFVVTLPLAPERRSEPATVPPEGHERRMLPMRVLVVDDNRDAADSLAELLRWSGAEPHVVYDGQAALQLLPGLRPDVVLLDLGMPGMDGYELARQIRARPEGRDLPLVALSGWGQEDDRRRSRDAGFDRHLVKPAEPLMLQALLADLGGARRAATAAAVSG